MSNNEHEAWHTMAYHGYFDVSSPVPPFCVEPTWHKRPPTWHALAAASLRRVAHVTGLHCDLRCVKRSSRAQNEFNMKSLQIHLGDFLGSVMVWTLQNHPGRPLNSGIQLFRSCHIYLGKLWQITHVRVVSRCPIVLIS